jgi:DNA adenine methylase
LTLKTIIKYAGGKTWLVPHLKGIWSLTATDATRLVEPFVGGLSVALGLNPKTALLNDINPHLIDLYRSVSDGELNRITVPFDNNKEAYYLARNRFNQLIRDPLHDRAIASQLLYYLNRTCFNGLMRFSRNGFNTPIGDYKTINYLNGDDFALYSQTLQRWQFACGDFENLKIQPQDWIYLDPPYDSDGDKAFTSYFGKFSWGDRVRLTDWAAAQTVPIVLSDLATARAIELYSERGFKITTVTAPRRISASGNRKGVIEIVALKNL